MGGPDWDLVEHPAPPRGGGAAPAPVPVPKRDVVLTDGQELSVGDERFTIVAIPGHTPGSIGVIFPVRDGRARHVAGLFGGTILIPGRISDADLETYVRSIEHFAAAARKMNVDVEIQNHPLYDDIAAKVSKVRAGNRTRANPFVVGRDAYQRFLTVQSECIQAQMARRRTA
jgi:metallo-beta-lactamase class B